MHPLSHVPLGEEFPWDHPVVVVAVAVVVVEAELDMEEV